MLSPADLLEMAETFAHRIPRESTNEDERAVIWQMIGEQYLRFGNPKAAQRALSSMPLGELETRFRCNFAKWALAHPESDLGRDVLRTTIKNIERLDPWLYPGDWTDLETISQQLLDPKDALSPSPPEEIPEELITRVRMALEKATELAKQATERAQQILVTEAPTAQLADTPSDALTRYLTYRNNDLKVRWLVDRAVAGGLDNPNLEAQLNTEDFQRVEPDRQPGIEKDPSHLGPVDFAAFLFARPVPLIKADEELLHGERHKEDDPDKTRMVVLATQLFLDFKAIGQRYSSQQIDQGLWFLFSYPYQLGNYLDDEAAPLEIRLACLEAMIVPFRDYLQTRPDEDEGAFYMWWDFAEMRGPDTAPVARRVLEEILEMSGWACQKAALHGLHHLHATEETLGIFTRFLEKHGAELEPDHLDYAEWCREFEAQ